jgi:hypothetical protein
MASTLDLPRDWLALELPGPRYFHFDDERKRLVEIVHLRGTPLTTSNRTATPRKYSSAYGNGDTRDGA